MEGIVMKNRCMMRIAAALLCVSMLLSGTVYASEPAPAETLISEDTASGDAPEEDLEVNRQVLETEALPAEQPETEVQAAEASGTEAKAAEVPETEALETKPSSAARETEPEQPETEIIKETEKQEETEKEEKHVITGFVSAGGPLTTVQFDYYSKPSLAEAIDALPKTLDVYLDGAKKALAIPVTWTCAADYAGSSFFYYQFDPVWDKEIYSLSAKDAVPYASVTFAAGAVSGEDMARSMNESSSDNALAIFRYLTGTMGLNAAAASGIMANIYCESGFYADIEEDTTRADKGYGLCQWTFGRRTDLVNFCKANHCNYKTVDGQMKFLEYELNASFPSLLSKLKSTANTAAGAYQAGYNWCYYFERPYNYEVVSVSRGNLARDSYWPVYSAMPTGSSGSSSPYLFASGASVPSAMSVGSSFPIRGTISASAEISSLTVGVYDAAGNMKIGRTVKPGSKTYSLANVDEYIVFSQLTAGVYRYRVTAVNKNGTYYPVEGTFAVLSNARTVADGTYRILSSKNNQFDAGVSGNSKNENASIVLSAKSTSTFQNYSFTYQSGGYYKIKNAGSGKYLTVASQASASRTNVTQTAAGTLWQVLPDGQGNYYLVPKCAPACGLDLSGGKVASGTNIQIYTHNLTASQRWKLEKIAAAPAALTMTVSGHSLPGTLKLGEGFGISGVVKSNKSLSSVTVGVYDCAGKMKIGKTVSPGSSSYNLSGVDASIRFGQLAAGVYYYKITAKADNTTKVLASKSFVVLANGSTVSNGTYRILSSKNSQFDAGVSGNSKTEGASVVLNAKSTSTFQNYTFTYQGSGYYKIKNVGTGKFLTVASQSSASRTNVTLTAAGTLWQVLPDGQGNHYLVPKCAPACGLDLSGGKLAAGTNIQIYTHNLTPSQRWKLETASSAATFTISGQTLPGTLKVGEGFGIEGQVKSNKTLTSVTVGVYDSAGKMKIGKTVSPGKASYDLSGVDYSIRFGQLAAGGYTYKITATAGGTTKTLASKCFVVLANAATVSNGTYRIVSAKNNGYDLMIAGSSKTNNAALQLQAASGKTSEKFKFIYQSNGYYKIQNVNSGLYLTTENRSSALSTRIVQSSSAALWQVLPDGNGAYYLVTSLASGKAIDISGGKIANGTKIQIYTQNGTAAQRWLLK